MVIRFQRSLSIGGQHFILSTKLSEWIWDITCGHPGGVRALLTILMEAPESRPYRKDRKIVPLHAVQTVLNDLPRLFQALSYTSFNRSLPSETMIRNDPALAAFLREMLSFDAYEGDCSSNEKLRVCHQEDGSMLRRSQRKTPSGVRPTKRWHLYFPPNSTAKNSNFCCPAPTFHTTNFNQ